MTSKQPLVSIVTPVYNAESFLPDTINSVQNQAYQNWEWLLVDDQSSDSSVEIIKKAQRADKRIKLISMPQNGGAAKARNAGIEAAQGKYVAFLDADDLWVTTKLEKQVAFMQQHDSAFSFTGYEFAGADGKPNGKQVSVPSTINYHQALKNTTIWTSTVMLDMSKLSKSDASMPDIGSEDTATWWNILRKGHVAYGLSEILSYYRRTSDTLSADKIVAIKRTWRLYRGQQNLGLIYSAYCFCLYVINAIRRRV